MSNIQIGHMVEFLGYEGNLPEEYRPAFKPGQTVRITDIAKNDAGDLLYSAAPIDLKGHIIEDIPTETLFSDEFEVIEANGGFAPGAMAGQDPGEYEQLQGREYTLHPITDKFPEMSEAAFEELKADIEERGQLVPVVALPDSRIIDGKHRFRACQELGIPPSVEIYTGPQSEKALFEYVRGLNARRRHLDAKQLAKFAAKRKSEGVSQGQIAQEAGVTQSAISKTLQKKKYSKEYSGDSETKSKGYRGTQKSKKSATATEKQYDSLIKAWNKANEEARVQFIEEVGLQFS